MGGIFTKLFGNDATKRRVGALIRGGTLPHAFLILGPEGSGRMTLSLEIAAALNCERRHEATGELPCHVCNTCKRILAGGFTDVKILQRSDGKMTVGVGEVRLFREDMFLSATESEYKIYIIEDADTMTPNAQNALLKVLEEPPSNVVIMLLAAESDGILTTIKSRTQQISMQRFSEGDIIKFLKSRGVTVSEDKLLEIATCSEGKLGRALALTDGEAFSEISASREITLEIIRALKSGTPYAELYNAIKLLPTKRDKLVESIENILLALRDLLLVKTGSDVPLLYFTSRELAKEVGGGMSTRRILGIYDVMKDTLDALLTNVNATALITSLGAKIKLI